jgi:hypothetical protein
LRSRRLNEASLEFWDLQPASIQLCCRGLVTNWLTQQSIALSAAFVASWFSKLSTTQRYIEPDVDAQKRVVDLI